MPTSNFAIAMVERKIASYMVFKVYSYVSSSSYSYLTYFVYGNYYSSLKMLMNLQDTELTRNGQKIPQLKKFAKEKQNVIR